MGLFNIFSKSNSKKVVQKVEEYYGVTSDLLGEIEKLALRYSVDEDFIEAYNEEKLDVNYLNKAREQLEKALQALGKSLDEYYDNEYTTFANTSESNKVFAYSLYALITLFNNSLDLYQENASVRDDLNIAYNKCNEELVKVKEILSDDNKLQAFTGMMPIEIEDEVIAEISEDIESNEEDIEEVENDNEKEETEVNADENEDVDGDVIVNTDKIKVYFIRRSRDEDDKLNINFCIENKYSKDIVVKSKDVFVDGMITEPTFNCSISSGDRVYEKMIFDNSVEQLINFKSTLCVIEKDTSNTIEECNISMFE